MEMCYDGTLVMPSDYAVMSEEERTYVEGGVSTQRKCYVIRLVLNSHQANMAAIGINTASFTYSSIAAIPGVAMTV